MTEVEFSRKLSELSSVAAELNRESDSINALLTKFEEQIAALNVGVEAGVELDANLGTLRWSKVFRGIKNGKSEYRWGLVLLVGKSERPILECSRDERIAALKELPWLVERLKDEAKARLDVIRQAKQFVK